MGLIDQKKDVFTTIGAYTSLREEQDLPETNNTFDSINNNEDVGSFLIDVLGVTVGTTALQNLTGELFTNFADSAKGTLKDGVKKQLIDYNSGNQIPQSFKNGISVSAKDIDIYGKLKSSPSSEGGKLLYSEGVENFDKKAYQAISNAGTDVQYNNLLINYNSSNDSFVFKPTSGSENNTIGEWLGEYIDNGEFLNKKEFQTNVLDNIFGSVTSNQDKSIEEIVKEQELRKAIQKGIEGDDTFVVPEDEYDEIINKAHELKNGNVNYDMGCDFIKTELPLSGMTDLISQISGSTDPNFVGEKMNETLDNSFEGTGNEETSNENQETIRNGFFARILDFIKFELVKTVTLTPQSRMLFALSSSFQNDGIPQLGDPLEDLPKFKVYINCLIKEALNLLYEFIFNLVVTFLVKLISPVIKKIIKEKISQYIGIIKSLISSQL